MQHKLRLHKEPFLLIKNWEKTIESRLLDEKRQKIKIWDELIFISRESAEEIKTEVLKIYKEKDFEKLAKIIDLEKTWTKKVWDFLESLELYYSKEKQKVFWVVALEFLNK